MLVCSPAAPLAFARPDTCLVLAGCISWLGSLEVQWHENGSVAIRKGLVARHRSSQQVQIANSTLALQQNFCESVLALGFLLTHASVRILPGVCSYQRLQASSKLVWPKKRLSHQPS